MEKLKMMSLFSGSGGFELASQLCGILPVYASEVECYPIAVTKSRFPNMKHLGDVSKVNGYDLEPVDIITFGSPCQDMSVAGKRAGLKHADKGDDETTRSGLFMETIRIIREMRGATGDLYPRFAVWENVPGAFSSNKGEDFQCVLQEMCKVADAEATVPKPERWGYAGTIVGNGYSVAWRTFDAQYWGVPQRRRRIYLVADFRGECAGQVLFKRDCLRGHYPQSGTKRQGTSEDAAGCSGTSYTLKIRSGCDGGGKGALVQENLSATLATNNDQYLFQNTGRGWWNESGVAETLRTPCGGDSMKANIITERVEVIEPHGQDSRWTLSKDGTVPTLVSAAGTGGG